MRTAEDILTENLKKFTKLLLEGFPYELLEEILKQFIEKKNNDQSSNTSLAKDGEILE